MADYYAALSAALRQSGLSQPRIVLDLDRLNHNIAAIKAAFPRGKQVRIVDKSLPSLPLLRHLSDALGSHAFMSFHLAQAAAIQKALPEASCLFGKPMPVEGARKALASGEIDPARSFWLIDSLHRLNGYAQLSREIGRKLHCVLEVDIGLHRGGFESPATLQAALALLRTEPMLQGHGLMGYEAHISHTPRLFGGAKGALHRSGIAYQRFIGCLEPSENAVLNLGGSTTTLLYQSETAATELALGSAFVMPSDFDKPSLAALKPALFIATPVLKVGPAFIPGLDGLSRLLQRLGLFPRHCCFLYGGKWMAKPVFPAGMRENRLIGTSSNQQFMALPRGITVAPDDIALFRPTQSEFVMQLFGALQVMQGGRIVDEWPVLPLH